MTKATEYETILDFIDDMDFEPTGEHEWYDYRCDFGTVRLARDDAWELNVFNASGTELEYHVDFGRGTPVGIMVAAVLAAIDAASVPTLCRPSH